jgi:transcriptional regulator with XRE-family HTH domain
VSTFGERVREIRKQKHMSQSELGNRLGINLDAVTHIEKRGNTPRPQTIHLYAAALGVEPRVLWPEVPESIVPEDYSIADRIRQHRLARGWTQTDLAKRLGIAQNAISQLEKGNHNPRADTLARLARAFEITLDDLLYGDVVGDKHYVEHHNHVIELTVDSHRCGNCGWRGKTILIICPRCGDEW